MKYRKKPIVIEAVQYNDTEASVLEIMELTSNPDIKARSVRLTQDGINIDTLEGRMLASVGDYIIKGVQGEFYPCKPDIFELTYEQVKEIR